MKSLLTCCLLLSFAYFGLTQEKHNAVIEEDAILLQFSEKLGIYNIHQFKAHETLYSIARSYGSNVAEVKKYNPFIKSDSIAIGEKMIIPVRTQNIISYKNELEINNNYIKVFYKTRPKDNLFRIARNYFPQDIKILMSRNNLTSLKINIGQTLLVGWMIKTGIHNGIQKEYILDSINLAKQNGLDALGSNIEVVSEIPIVKELRGIAIWDKENTDFESLIVLHSNARLNSIIELSNPMFRDKKVYARVIGPIPKKIYPDDVNVIISPKVAQLLNAIDSRLLIEMKYYE